MVWQLNSQGKKNCKSTESFCHIILVIYTMIGPLFDMFDAAMLICFSGKVVNEWKPRTTLYPYWQPGPPGLASMLTKLQASFSVPCDQKLSCKLNLSSFKAVPPNKLSFYLGSMLHIISSLFSYFRSWDYPKNLGFNLKEKVKPSLSLSSICMFLNRTEQNSNLTAFSSKVQVYCGSDWTNRGPHENEFWQFPNAKMQFLNR